MPRCCRAWPPATRWWSSRATWSSRTSKRRAPRINIERRPLVERLIRFSIAHRWLMLLLTLGLSALGVWSFTRLPIDVTPDITNVQVQINTEAPGFSPMEAEQRITFVIEGAIAGLPRLDYSRSLSRYGLSQVTVAFEDGTDIYFARQQEIGRASCRERV